MTSSIDAVVFDVGGVFVLPNPEVLRPALAELGVDAPDETFHRAHYLGTASLDLVRSDAGATSNGWPEYLSTYAHTLLARSDGPWTQEVAPGRDMVATVASALRRIWDRPAIELWSWVQTEAVDALARLVEAEWPVAIVSNADGTVEESLRARGVCQVGDGDGCSVLHITDSHVIGIEKPDAAIFTDVLAVMAERDVAPGQCLYVGDTWSADVVGARAAGMQVVQIDPYDLYTDHDHAGARSVTEVVNGLLAPA